MQDKIFWVVPKTSLGLVCVRACVRAIRYKGTLCVSQYYEQHISCMHDAHLYIVHH